MQDFWNVVLVRLRTAFPKMIDFLSRSGARVAQRVAVSKTRVFQNDGLLDLKIVFVSAPRPWSSQAHWQQTSYVGMTVNARIPKFFLNRRQQRERSSSDSVSSVTSCSN
jgi:hypothetical protein